MVAEANALRSICRTYQFYKTLNGKAKSEVKRADIASKEVLNDFRLQSTKIINKVGIQLKNVLERGLASLRDVEEKMTLFLD